MINSLSEIINDVTLLNISKVYCSISCISLLGIVIGSYLGDKE